MIGGKTNRCWALGLALLFLLGACSGPSSGGAPEITAFTATPNDITAAGEEVTLSWTVVGAATALEIDQGIGSVSGTKKVVNPTGPTTYTLVARNARGSDERSVGVTVGGNAPPTPGNRDPVAAFTFEQVEVDDSGVRIKFSALDSSDPDGDSLGYAWDFGDDSSAASRDYTKKYKEDGTYTVTLTVTDGKGGRASTSKDVPIDAPGSEPPAPPEPPTPEPEPPVITSFEASPNPLEKGEDATLSWSTSGTVTELAIDQDVGAVTGQTDVEVSPEETTTYTLTASNEGGSGSATVTVEVVDSQAKAPPLAVISAPTTVGIGDEVVLDASGSSDPDGGELVSYAWAVTGPLGLKTPFTGETVSFYAIYPGEYAVELSVTDDEGAVSAMVTATVTAEPGGGDNDEDNDGDDDGGVSEE